MPSRTHQPIKITHNHPPDLPKTQKIIVDLGRLPIEDTPLGAGPLQPTAETVLAMAIDAILKARPIAHDLSQSAANVLITEGYFDIRKLAESSSEERTAALEAGGYNIHRERASANLGNLARLVQEDYDGDLNNLLEEANHDRERVRQLLKQVKGLGDVGIDIFFNNVQSVWPSMAPWMDRRSLQAGGEIGIGTDLDSLYEELDRDPVSMSRLASGLSTARLEKVVEEMRDD